MAYKWTISQNRMVNREIKDFQKIQRNLDSLINSLQNGIKFVWFTCFFKTLLAGRGRGTPSHPFILQNCLLSFCNENL